MVGAIISFFVAILSFNFFMMSYQINGINRLVYGAPMSLFETAINLYDVDEVIGPCFDKPTLVDNISSYFAYHMPRYTSEYSLSYYYYNIADHSLNMSDDVQAVEVTINASIVLAYQYSRTMFYEIRSN